MKQILVELDDRCARDLERVAPTKKRLRAEFVRQAVRRAIDLALDRSTEEAYRQKPLSRGSGGIRSSWLGQGQCARAPSAASQKGTPPSCADQACGVKPRARREPSQFDIWWVELPNPVGRRPVLLLSRTSAFSYLTRVLVVEVTTTIRGIPQEVALGRREGLSRPCVANLDALRTIRA